jgi:hypothetical protein
MNIDIKKDPRARLGRHQRCGDAWGESKKARAQAIKDMCFSKSSNEKTKELGYIQRESSVLQLCQLPMMVYPIETFIDLI